MAPGGTGVRLIGRDEVTGRRERIVLAALALVRPAAASQETLAEALWPDGPPASSGKVIQGCVSRLRVLLGADAIATVAAGYQLSGAVRTAADVFAAEVERGRELLELGQADRAAYVLAEALQGWSGSPYGDLARWPPAEAESARLAELAAQAEELRVDALLAAGRLDRALPLARAQAAAEPVREQRWAQVALAEYRRGNQADALDALRQCRATLLDELGLDPGPAIRDLETAILRQDPSLLGPPEADDDSPACPWPGLSAYGPEDADSFFGRDAELLAALDLLDARGVLAVVGPSGIGKSSFVRAGVVAALRGRGLSVQLMTPGIPAQSGGVAVLVLDQAEDLFLLPGPRRQALLQTLAEHRGKIVVALRADRMADLGAQPILARLVEQGLFLLGGLTPGGLTSAVERPAAQHGLLVEPGLLELLLRDLEGEPAALPLFSHALAQTWERREGRTLTVAGYRASGGVRGAVAQSAEEVYGRLSPGQQRVLRSLMMRLVSPGPEGEPHRARLSAAQLDVPELHDLVGALVSSRLLTSDEGNITLTHEALVGGWPRLRDWLDDDVEGQRVFHHLTVAARSWDELGRPESEVYRGVRLARALDWAATSEVMLSSVEQAYLDAGRALEDAAADELAARVRRQTRTNRILRVLLAGLCLVLVGGLLAAGLAVREGHRARQAALAATANRVGAAALDESDPQLALLLAAAAAATDPGPDAGAALAAVLARRPQLVGTYRSLDAAGGRFSSLRVSDGAVFVSDRSHRVLRLTQDGLRVDGAYQVPPGRLDFWEVPIAVSPDVLAVAGAPGVQPAVLLLDPRTLRPLRAQLSGIPNRPMQPADISISSNGRYLAASVGYLRMPEGSVDGWAAGVWELSTGRLVRWLDLPDHEYPGVIVTDDAATLYASAPLAAYDVGSGDRRWSSIGNYGPVIALQPGGGLLATRDEQSSAVLVDPNTGKLVRQLATQFRTEVVEFSPDGTRLAATGYDQDAMVFDVATGEVDTVLDTGGTLTQDVAWAEDSTTLITVSPRLREVHEWDLSNRLTPLREIRLPAAISEDALGYAAGMNYSQGARIAQSARWATEMLDTAWMVDLEQRDVWPVPVLDRPLWVQPEISPDETTVALAYDGGWLQTVDLATRAELAQRQVLPTTLDSLTWTGSGSHVRLVAADDDGTLQALDPATLDPVGPPARLPFTAFVLAGSPDGHTVLAATGSSRWGTTWHVPIDSWYQVDLDTGEVVAQGRLPVTDAKAMAYSPDGRLVAIGGEGDFAILDTTTGRPLQPARSGNEGDVVSVRWSDDGSRVLTGSLAGDVAEWSGTDGRLVATARLPVPQVNSAAAFTSEGTVRIVTSALQAYDWDPSTSAAIGFACRTAGRELTPQEWSDAFGDQPYWRVCAA